MGSEEGMMSDCYFFRRRNDPVWCTIGFLIACLTGASITLAGNFTPAPENAPRTGQRCESNRWLRRRCTDGRPRASRLQRAVSIRLRRDWRDGNVVGEKRRDCDSPPDCPPDTGLCSDPGRTNQPRPYANLTISNPTQLVGSLIANVPVWVQFDVSVAGGPDRNRVDRLAR